jgi:hypothetical protein
MENKIKFALIRNQLIVGSMANSIGFGRVVL